MIGCGGSSFSDCGYGCMSELFGFPPLQKFSDVLGLNQLTRDDWVKIDKILIPCDVQNPLCGPVGATRMFGPQKGAKLEDLDLLD